MSLNNISLPSQLLADLYKNVLVQGSASAVPVKVDVAFLGKNEKNILIVVNKDDAPFLPDNELSFLTNVLSACQLGLADVAIVNWNKLKEKNVEDIFEQLQSREVLLFNIDPSMFGLPEEVQSYSVNKMGSHQVVVAPSLSEIEKNKEAKKQLWLALKQLFGI
ncbi:MAG: hypothetical protein EOO10_11820 [Chitinophagaceae bacterium]|nr:MAG: hypothetical protein EOO10_11820 [Chitinophagaceae bacterium]